MGRRHDNDSDDSDCASESHSDYSSGRGGGHDHGGYGDCHTDLCSDASSGYGSDSSDSCRPSGKGGKGGKKGKGKKCKQWDWRRYTRKCYAQAKKKSGCWNWWTVVFWAVVIVLFLAIIGWAVRRTRSYYSSN